MKDVRHGDAVAVVTVDALADLRREIPRKVRQGTWITVDASTRVPATSAKVVVLGPRGLPFTVPTSFDAATGQIVARFNADAPGAWMVQALAALEVGPLPVLEARVYVGVDTPRDHRTVEAPGERLAASEPDDARALHAMLDAARATQGLPPLDRDVRLDRVAAAHVQEMMAVGELGHDVGDGTPPSRLEQAGIVAREAGENVARAPSAALAHRALWWSPSHRTNMLHARYSRVGIAAQRDAAGLLWVTQVFTN